MKKKVYLTTSREIWITLNLVFENCTSAIKKNEWIHVHLSILQVGETRNYTCKLTYNDVSFEFDEVFSFTRTFELVLDPLNPDISCLKDLLEESLRQTSTVTFDGNEGFGKINIELKSPLINCVLNASMEFSDATTFAIPASARVREYHGIATSGK